MVLRPFLRALTTTTLAGLPARDAVAVSLAALEQDAPYAALALGFSWLAASVEAPAGLGVSVAALLSLLITSVTGGDLGLEFARVALPLALSLYLARVSTEFPGAISTDDNRSGDDASGDTDSWQQRLDERMRRRDETNSATVDALVNSVRGLSAAKGRALKECCRGRDPLLLSEDDWARCEGIGRMLAPRIVEALRELDRSA